MKIKAKNIPNPIASIMYVQNGGLAVIGSRSNGLFFILLINLSTGISLFSLSFGGIGMSKKTWQFNFKSFPNRTKAEIVILDEKPKMIC